MYIILLPDVYQVKCTFAELSICSVGECYLTDWTVWSPCQLSCVSGDDLGFGSVQVRSRAVVAQDPENLLQCPEQELEARPCTGQSGRCPAGTQNERVVH